MILNNMTQEDKQLLLKDLCARLPYGVKVNYKGLIRPLFSVSPTQHYKITLDNAIDGEHNGLEFVRFDDEIKPYLRPMSSMTEEERNEYFDFRNQELQRVAFAEIGREAAIAEISDWLNSHNFDFRGLIEKGLALEAPEGMY